MAVTAVQGIDTFTTTNGPISITPTLGSASTAGNLLVMHVCASGTSPTITLPAGWTTVSNIANATLACAIFSFPNNTGGITGVSVTVSAPNGGAVASIIEFAGVGASAYQFATNVVTQNGTGPTLARDPVVSAGAQGQLIYTAIGFQAATFTPTGASAEWNFVPVIGGAVSTTATTNAQHQALWGITSYASPLLTATLGSTVTYIVITCHFNNVGSMPFSGCQVGGSGGSITPFYQGMIGG